MFCFFTINVFTIIAYITIILPFIQKRCSTLRAGLRYPAATGKEHKGAASPAWRIWPFTLQNVLLSKEKKGGNWPGYSASVSGHYLDTVEMKASDSKEVSKQQMLSLLGNLTFIHFETAYHVFLCGQFAWHHSGRFRMLPDLKSDLTHLITYLLLFIYYGPCCQLHQVWWMLCPL